MIITDTIQDVEVSGAQTTNAFTIKASAKAFQILSSNLYSNPLGAMIRELSTNAYDAHVDAGKKDVPFIITVPNALAPNFKIRDYGTGLTEEQIYKIYTTFFESTKTNSNDVVGCLGLGSKSPFGVADQFTINSYVDGTKTVYSAFLDSARIPSIAKFIDLPTDEENGIEIEVSLRQDDARYFTNELKRQLKWFNLKPIIEGDENFSWEELGEPTLSGTNWAVYRGQRDSVVVQGQIAYPISIRDMGNSFKNAENHYFLASILDGGFVFDVNIGDVNIAPSREALTYDDATTNKLIELAEKAGMEIFENIKEKIDQCSTFYDAVLLFNTLVDDMPRAVRNMINTLEYNGQKLSNKCINLKPADCSSIHRWYLHYNGKKIDRIEVYLSREFEGTDANGDSIYTQYYNVEIEKTTHYFYMEKDVKGLKERLTQYTKDHVRYRERVYVFQTDHSFDELQALLPGFPLQNAADLEKVRRKAPEKKEKKDGIAEVTLFQRWGNKTSTWETKEVNIADLDGAYYVDIERYEAKLGNETMDFKDAYEAAVELKLLPEAGVKVYGLRAKNQPKAKDWNMVNFFDMIRDQATKIIEEIMTYNFLDSALASKLEYHSYDIIRYLLEDEDLKDSPFIELFKKVMHNKDTNFSTVTNKVIAKLGFERTSVTIPKSDCAKYSMFRQMGYYFDRDAVKEYILMVDNCSKQ